MVSVRGKGNRERGAGARSCIVPSGSCSLCSTGAFQVALRHTQEGGRGRGLPAAPASHQPHLFHVTGCQDFLQQRIQLGDISYGLDLLHERRRQRPKLGTHLPQ
jgi:hypothetical protein